MVENSIASATSVSPISTLVQSKEKAVTDPVEISLLTQRTLPQPPPEFIFAQLLESHLSPDKLGTIIAQLNLDKDFRMAVLDGLNRDSPWIIRQDLNLRCNIWVSLRPYAAEPEIQSAMLTELERGLAFPQSSAKVIEILNSSAPIADLAVAAKYVRLVDYTEESVALAELLGALAPRVTIDLDTELAQDLRKTFMAQFEQGRTPSQVLTNAMVACANNKTLDQLTTLSLGTALNQSRSVGQGLFSLGVGITGAIALAHLINSICGMGASAMPQLGRLFTALQVITPACMAIFGVGMIQKLVDRSFSTPIKNEAGQRSLTQALVQATWHPGIRAGLLKLVKDEATSSELAALAKNTLLKGDYSRISDQEIKAMLQDDSLNPILENPVKAEYMRRRLGP